MKIKSDEKKNKKPINWNGVKWKPSSGWSVDGSLQTTWGALLFAIMCYVVRVSLYGIQTLFYPLLLWVLVSLSFLTEKTLLEREWGLVWLLYFCL